MISNLKTGIKGDPKRRLVIRSSNAVVKKKFEDGIADLNAKLQAENTATVTANDGGATATAAAALRAQYGVIIIDEFIGPDILSHYEYLFKENVIAELNLISIQPASSEPDNNQINVGEKIIQYHHEDQYLMIADLIQDLVGKGETIVTLSN